MSESRRATSLHAGNWRAHLLVELERCQAKRSRPIRAKALPYWLRTALAEEFGSVNAARKLAGLASIRDDTLSSDQVVPEIRRRHSKGLSLAYTHVPRALVSAAVAQFGSWRAGIEAAGLDYAQLGLKVKRYSDEDLIAWLRSLATVKPKMKLTELMKERHFAATVARFEGWENAVKRAGLTNWPLRQRRVWTKSAVITEMRTLARAGKSTSSDPRLYEATQRIFGSLRAAASAAGVSSRAPRTMSRSDLIERLRELARTQGTVTHALATKAGIDSAARTIFGTLSAACEAAGVAGYRRQRAEYHANQERPRVLLAELQRIAHRLKRPIVRRDLPWSLHQALLRHFESLGEARAAARLPQPARSTVWTRRRVLDELAREHRQGTRITRNGLIAAGRGDLLSAVVVHVGTLQQARRLAKIPTPKRLPFRHVPFLKKWDEDLVLEAIHERVTAGKGLAPSLVPRPLLAAASRYWGSWRTAVEVAGHDYAKLVLRKDHSDRELLDLIRMIAAKRPDMTLDRLRGLPITTTLYRRFGTPEAAAALAGLNNWPQRQTFPVTPARQLRSLLRARLRSGQSIAPTSVERHVRFSMSRIHPVWSVALSRLGIDAPRSRSGRRA